MKVVTSKQMGFLESLAYRNGSSEEEFMEEAGKGVALEVDKFVLKHHLKEHVYLLCGKGNNAGDAYVAGIYLLELGYTVFAYQVIIDMLNRHIDIWADARIAFHDLNEVVRDFIWIQV